MNLSRWEEIKKSESLSLLLSVLSLVKDDEDKYREIKNKIEQIHSQEKKLKGKVSGPQPHKISEK